MENVETYRGKNDQRSNRRYIARDKKDMRLQIKGTLYVKIDR